MENDINEETWNPLVNQTLYGHSGNVISLDWNPKYQKLASTDEYGLTIVWGIQNDGWCQDMVNNQNNSYVKDMKWTIDGELICLVYQDGTVIVGSVEGSRLWGIELDVPLCCVEWLPGNKNVVFVTAKNEIKLYDVNGNHLNDVNSCLSDTIKSINWYNESSKIRPSLAIASVSGEISLLSKIGEPSSYIFNTNLREGICRWNPKGGIFAICGYKISNETKETADRSLVVMFYDINGQRLHEVLISEEDSLVDFEWESSGTRLTVATETCLFFINVRMPYTWTPLNSNSTLVYQCQEVSPNLFYHFLQNSYSDFLEFHNIERENNIFQ